MPLNLETLRLVAQLHHAYQNRQRDPLTQAFARSSGEEVLALQFEVAERSNTPLTVAVLDIDRLSEVNERHSHPHGDQLLADLPKHIAKTQRQGDMLVRWSGKRFLLMLPNTSLEHARIALERFRKHGFGLRPDGQPVTLSVGVAERQADTLASWTALVEKAEARALRVKQEGRDGVRGDDEVQHAHAA